MSKHGPGPASLRITGSGYRGPTEVLLDGQNVAPALAGITLRLGVEAPPTAVLDVLIGEVSTEVGHTQIVIPGETHRLLVQLGWTPPEGDGAS